MLMLAHRRGFTLAEIMLGLVVTLVVTGSIYNLLLATQRVTRAQAQRVMLQSSLRAGSLIVLNELAELSTATGGTPDQNDVLTMGSSAITYRAMRGMGIICHLPGATVIRLARSTFTGHRDPQAGRDRAFVFVPGNAETADSWVPRDIVTVATAAPCPGGQGPGITLTLSSSPSLEALEVGTPVRITELMEFRLYRADGRSWLGARSVSAGELIQPLLGPLTDVSGFELEYLDATGSPTADRSDVKSIQVRLRGMVESAGDNAAPPEEELVTRVALRNSPAT
ncbi:MAG: hypothetical protein H0T58_03715 [Gemmatimonadales bacterium]|nr:hypothetical protein [Gemmatimonadales bacterium]